MYIYIFKAYQFTLPPLELDSLVCMDFTYIHTHTERDIFLAGAKTVC